MQSVPKRGRGVGGQLRAILKSLYSKLPIQIYTGTHKSVIPGIYQHIPLAVAFWISLPSIHSFFILNAGRPSHLFEFEFDVRAEMHVHNQKGSGRSLLPKTIEMRQSPAPKTSNLPSCRHNWWIADWRQKCSGWIRKGDSCCSPTSA